MEKLKSLHFRVGKAITTVSDYTLLGLGANLKANGFKPKSKIVWHNLLEDELVELHNLVFPPKKSREDKVWDRILADIDLDSLLHANHPTMNESITSKNIATKLSEMADDIKTYIVKRQPTFFCKETKVSAGELKTKFTQQAISDASWSTFVNMLEYKSDWNGKNILRIGRFSPSSKTCNCCGYINKELQLKDREWTCECGSVLNRDVNASINIKNFALKNYLSGEHTLKNRNELPTLVGVLTCEASFKK